ncbi:MAG: ribbon-helix-helix domain-containing protein [Steroidobacteraceae bacterium]
MGKTKRSVEVAYLDQEKLDLLKRLAAQTRIARSVLVREAIDDLLIKYKLLRAPRR